MQITSENIYCNSLIAVFDAAFKLGLDPYALAVQANLNLKKYWEFSPRMVSQRACHVIEESLLTARLLNEPLLAVRSDCKRPTALSTSFPADR